MTEVVRIVRVFVSSPSDCEAERVVLDEVVQRINETPPAAGVRVELFRWERNVVPRIGPPAQKVIDDQTPVYGIYLGIMAHRFGTPTGKYGSRVDTAWPPDRERSLIQEESVDSSVIGSPFFARKFWRSAHAASA